MRLLVFGASGGVGRHVVRLALDAGHPVTAVARRADGIDPRAQVVLDDVLGEGCFERHMAGHDAVVSALGLRRRSPANPWSRLVSPPDFCSRTATTMVAAMRANDVRRVVAVSAAGVGDSAGSMNALMKFFVARSNVGVAYRDLAVMERVFTESGLDWCCPRPTRLTHGPLTRRVTITDSFPMSAAITRADVAWWMLTRAEQRDPPVESRTPLLTSG